MKSKAFQYVMRGLITLLGAGLGAALLAAGLQLARLSNPGLSIPFGLLAGLYIGTALVFGLVFFAFSWRIYSGLTSLTGRILSRMDRMSMGQLFSTVVCFSIALVMAALLSRILTFMGESMFTTVSSMILYLALGGLGIQIGHRRYKDFLHMFPRAVTFHAKKGTARLKRRAGAPAKLADASALIDGRMQSLLETGFLEGAVEVPSFVVEELRRLSDSADTQKRARGRRGLENLQAMEASGVKVTQQPEAGEPDVALLRLARRQGSPILTCDYSLAKSATVSGLTALNINALSAALRPTVQAGDVLRLQLTKEGREANQAVGYTEDGTMVVVEGARALIGRTVEVTVTSALQTSAGRMIFAKRREDG